SFAVLVSVAQGTTGLVESESLHQPQMSTLCPNTTLFRSMTLEHALGFEQRVHLRDRHRINRMLERHIADGRQLGAGRQLPAGDQDRKSTRLNSSHVKISYAVFCLKKNNTH